MSRRAGVTAIVLAGGRATRFGSEKLHADVDGRTLLELSIQAAEQVADEIVIAGPVRADVTPASGAMRVPARTVADATPFAGPLAGLAGALAATTTPRAIVVGGDMPGLVPSVLREMLGRLVAIAVVDAVLLQGPQQTGSKRQVLPVAIRVARASAAAQEALAAGDRSLIRLLGRLRVHEISLADWRPLDPAARTLMDVDRPGDLDRVRDELRGRPFSAPR